MNLFGRLLAMLHPVKDATMTTPPDPAKPVLDLAVSLEEPFEGFVPHAYQDPVGVWTIGFGSTRDADGKPVCATTPDVTKDQARDLAERDLRGALVELERDVTVPLTPMQEAALLDFIYNLGAGNFRASTLLRKLNAKDYAGAANEFPRWNMAGGKVLAGLVRRRAAERAMFIRQDVSNKD